MQHLLFFGIKFFRELVRTMFPAHARDMPKNFLSLSFSSLTTYADKVQRSVSRARKSAADQRLVWLLERGIAFDGTSYLTERQVAAKYRGKAKILPYLDLSRFLAEAAMVRIVPIEAPKNFTADLTLRRGSARDASLPVLIKQTALEEDYPYLTGELGKLVGKNASWAAKAATVLGLKGNDKYHQQIRVSRSSSVQRYSEAALQNVRSYLVLRR